MLSNGALDRSSVYFFAQIFVCILVIVTALVNLTIFGTSREDETVWLILLSTCIGVLIPSPLGGGGAQQRHDRLLHHTTLERLQRTGEPPIQLYHPPSGARPSPA